MAKPLWVVAGVVLVLIGLLWTLQGIDVIEGSSMSGTTTWSIIGPIVLLVGAFIMSVGIRGRRP
jgi:drug/metabolite transporter superfamily protein YnfA